MLPMISLTLAGTLTGRKCLFNPYGTHLGRRPAAGGVSANLAKIRTLRPTTSFLEAWLRFDHPSKTLGVGQLGFCVPDGYLYGDCSLHIRSGEGGTVPLR